MCLEMDGSPWWLVLVWQHTKKWGNNIKVGFVNCRCVVGVRWWLLVVWMAVSRCAIRVRVFRLHKDGDKGLVAFSHLDLTLTLVFSLLTSKICPFETKFSYLDWKLMVHFNPQTIGGCVVIFESQGDTHAGETTRGKEKFPLLLNSNLSQLCFPRIRYHLFGGPSSPLLLGINRNISVMSDCWSLSHIG